MILKKSFNVYLMQADNYLKNNMKYNSSIQIISK